MLMELLPSASAQPCPAETWTAESTGPLVVPCHVPSPEGHTDRALLSGPISSEGTGSPSAPVASP